MVKTYGELYQDTRRRLLETENSEDAGVLAEALRENIASTQWLCGFPDKMAIYSINGGEYVVSTFGKNEAMDTFKTKLLEVYGESAALLVEEKIV